MAEKLVLTAPITVPSIREYRVERLTLDWRGQAILIQLQGPNGEAFSHAYYESLAFKRRGA